MLDSLQDFSATIHFHKVSDTEVSLNFLALWDWDWDQDFGQTIPKYRIRISVPVIELSGQPYDVMFDTTSDKASVTYIKGTDTLVYTPIVTVAGWIKEPGILTWPEDMGKDSSVSFEPVCPAYTCDFHISTILDNVPLDIRITKTSATSAFNI